VATASLPLLPLSKVTVDVLVQSSLAPYGGDSLGLGGSQSSRDGPKYSAAAVGGQIAVDIVRGTGVLINNDFGDHLGRDELRQGTGGFALIIRVGIAAKLGMEQILGMRRRRHDDLHVGRWFGEASDASARPKRSVRIQHLLA
jgi:hypothetical protein